MEDIRVSKPISYHNNCFKILTTKDIKITSQEHGRNLNKIFVSSYFLVFRLEKTLGWKLHNINLKKSSLRRGFHRVSPQGRVKDVVKAFKKLNHINLFWMTCSSTSEHYQELVEEIKLDFYTQYT